MKNSRSLSIFRKKLAVLSGLALLGLTLLPSCSLFRGEGSAKNLQAISSQGGTLEFENGIQLVVPANSVSEDTVIHLDPVDFAVVEDILEGALIPVKALSFFDISLEKGELQKAVKVILPVSTKNKFIGIPVHIEIDLDSREVMYHPTELVYDPDAGTIEFSLDSFSTHGVGTLPEEESHSDCDSPATACRCGWIRSESKAHDFSMGDCQALSYETTTKFMDCPGQPTEKHKDSERTAECDWKGSVLFQYDIAAEGIVWHLDCSDPIPFKIGEDDKLSGSGKTHCVLSGAFGEGGNLDLDYDAEIELSGTFDGFELDFDPFRETITNGHIRIWAMVEGSELALIDATFDDKSASADMFVLPEASMFSFVVPVEGEERDRSAFAFKFPLEDEAVYQTAIPGDGSLINLTITLNLEVE